MTGSDVICSHCGEEFGESAAFCPGCGQPASADPPEGDIYLMLMTANVLRLRGEWAQAEAKCSEVLRREPDNPTACSVMGDLARDQRRLRDAIEWYKMALDHNPESTADRNKLEAMIDQVFGDAPQGVLWRARSRVSEWVRRRAAVRYLRVPRLPALLALVVAVVLVGIFGVALSTIVLGRRAAPPPPPPTDKPPSGAFVTSAGERAEPTEQPEVSAGPRAAPDEVGQELVAREQEFLHYLRKQAERANPGMRVLGAELDPRDGVASLHVSVPRLWSGTRDSAVRSLGVAGSAAMDWDERIPRVRVRCDVREEGRPDQLAVVAEGVREHLGKLRQGTPAEIEKALSSVWWAPELR